MGGSCSNGVFCFAKNADIFGSDDAQGRYTCDKCPYRADARGRYTRDYKGGMSMLKINLKDLTYMDLRLFDGTAGAGAGTADSGSDAGSQTSSANASGPKRGGSGEFDNVVFGKQDRVESNLQTQKTDTSSDAGENKASDVKDTSINTLEDRRKAYRKLVEGEYKDIYTEDTQRIINKRFGGLEQKISQTKPVIDMLMERYKIADGDIQKLTAAVENDDTYWAQAADEAGMAVDQFKQMQKLRRENAALLENQRRQQNKQAAETQLQKWYAEAQTVRETYPDFDLSMETRNPQFLAMLRSGVPVRHAYEVIHMDDIKTTLAQNAAKQAEKQVVDDIRAKGVRPQENGTLSQSAFTVKDDPSKWSKKDRAEAIRRAARGETIKL